MNLRYLLLGFASAETISLLAGDVTIEILSTWYGENPSIGILGVVLGVVGGLLAGAIVTVAGDRLSGLRAAALVTYAVFGVAFLVIASLSHVNVPDADEVFTFPVLVVSIGVAVVAAVLATRGRVLPARTRV